MNNSAAQISQSPPVNLLSRIARSPAFRAVKYGILGGKLTRRIMTKNFQCGLVALGERNSYNFPMGWITVDWADADFPMWVSEQTRLPFADASQRIVYSAHMMEHLESDALQSLMQEIARILKPGGALRVEVPDAEKLVAALETDNRPFLEYFRASREEYLHAHPGTSSKNPGRSHHRAG